MTSQRRSGGVDGGGGFSGADPSTHYPYNNTHHPTSNINTSSSASTSIDPLTQWMQERQILMLTLC